MPIRNAGSILLALLGVAAAPTAGNEPPTFPIETRVIALDVVATDREGRPVDDLRQDELQVLENGRLCEIRVFGLVRAAPLPERAAFADTAVGKAAASSSTMPPGLASAPRPSLIVLVFDRLTIKSGRLARQGALDFLAREFPEETWFAVLAGRRFVVPPTTDRAAVGRGVEAATFGRTTLAAVTGTEYGVQDAEALDTISSIEALARALESVRSRKTILYFAEGWHFSLAVRPQYEEAISAATRANVTVHTFDASGLAFSKRVAVAPLDLVLNAMSAEHRGGPFGERRGMTPETDGVGTPAAKLAGPDIEDLAADTGGRAITNANDLRSGLKSISEELRCYYEVVYVPAEPAADGRFRRIEVKVSRPGVRIRTRRGYFATTPGRPTPARAERTTTARQPVPADCGSCQGADSDAPAQVETLERLLPTTDAALVPALERAAAYVVHYEESFRDVVAEETYYQSVFLGMRGAPGPRGTRIYYRTQNTRADLVFARLSDGAVPWTLFRDVYEVDGRKARDRDGRLERLFQHPSPSALVQARRIVEESARYNIGGAARTINVPTMPLVFLHPRNQPRFSFMKGGQRRIAGFEALEVRFEEISRPTIVTTSSGESLPARGSFWIDSSRGAVLRSEVVFRFEPSLADAAIETDYRPEPRLGLCVPTAMKERYWNLAHASRSIFGAPTEGKATYSNFRQFTVTTEESKAKLEHP